MLFLSEETPPITRDGIGTKVPMGDAPRTPKRPTCAPGMRFVTGVLGNDFEGSMELKGDPDWLQEALCMLCSANHANIIEAIFDSSTGDRLRDCIDAKYYDGGRRIIRRYRFWLHTFTVPPV